MHPSHASHHADPGIQLVAITETDQLPHPRTRDHAMATTSTRTHAHQHQQPPYGLRYEPLRRMQGLDLKTALRASPSASTAATAALLVPLAAALLGASGLALAATLTGLALAAPLLVLFSPVIVPAALAAALAATGLLASGAFGVAGVSALAWAAGYVLRGGGGSGGGLTGMVAQPLDHGEKRRGAEGPAAFVGHRPRDIDVVD
ncbi:oleosin 16.4 kDa [Setaria viridis]|nr:oleosin 16.4 kDa-like [Setaria viridis]